MIEYGEKFTNENKELKKALEDREKEKEEIRVLVEKYEKELDAKYDPINLKITESVLRIRDYTGLYFYPALIVGIYLGWQIGMKFCDIITKAYYP